MAVDAAGATDEWAPLVGRVPVADDGVEDAGADEPRGPTEAAVEGGAVDVVEADEKVAVVEELEDVGDGELELERVEEVDDELEDGREPDVAVVGNVQPAPGANATALQRGLPRHSVWHAARVSAHWSAVLKMPRQCPAPRS